MKHRDTERSAPVFNSQAGEPADSGHASATVAMLDVAYHAGPPELTFFGRLWYRGQPQQVTDVAWEAMQAREDFPIHDFRIA